MVRLLRGAAGEMLVHGSCAARNGDAVLFLGPPGSGKSDLVLRLIQGCGWMLVADDQVEVAPDGGEGLRAACPAPLAGMLEVRGLGIFEAVPRAEAVLRLAVELGPDAAVPRLPHPARWTHAGRSVPRLSLNAFECSAPAKVEWALEAARGRSRQRAGAFAEA